MNFVQFRTLLQRSAELESTLREALATPPTYLAEDEAPQAVRRADVLQRIENLCSDLATVYTQAAAFDGITATATDDLRQTARVWLERSETIRQLLADWGPT